MNKREKYHLNIPGADGRCQVITQTAATLVAVIDEYRKDCGYVPGETYSIDRVDTQETAEGSIDGVRAIAALWLIAERRKQRKPKPIKGWSR